MRQPAAGFGRGNQFGHRGVERGRFLAGNGVAGARNDAQPGGRHGAAQKDAAVDAPLVLVADQNQ